MTAANNSTILRGVRDPMVRALLREAVRFGSMLERTGSGHVMVKAPGGGRVVAASSPRSSHIHKTLRLQLEKQGAIAKS